METDKEFGVNPDSIPKGGLYQSATYSICR